MMRVILASQSPQRYQLLAGLPLEFEVMPADVDEKSIQDGSLIKRAELIALAKAAKVAASNPDAVIIAADTYVIHNDQALEKPADVAEARRMLQQQSGQWLEEVSGWCLVTPQEGTVSGSSVTRFRFRELSMFEIEHYVTHQPVTTWSAAFSPAYPAGAGLIAEIEGSLTGFTHGLPIEEIVPRLRAASVAV